MKKLGIGNIGTGNTSTLATIGRLLAAVVLLAVGGCKMKDFASTSLYSGYEVRFTGAVEDPPLQKGPYQGAAARSISPSTAMTRVRTRLRRSAGPFHLQGR